MQITFSRLFWITAIGAAVYVGMVHPHLLNPLKASAERIQTAAKQDTPALIDNMRQHGEKSTVMAKEAGAKALKWLESTDSKLQEAMPHVADEMKRAGIVVKEHSSKLAETARGKLQSSIDYVKNNV